jgi:hypothetical protein
MAHNDRASDLDWLPAGELGVLRRLVPAGRYWDAIRVRQRLCDLVMNRLDIDAPHPAAVLGDRNPRDPGSYFFVPAGTADRWDAPGTRSLGTTQYLSIPVATSADWVRPPTPYGWMIAPKQLQDAVLSAHSVLSGPRASR